MDIVDLGMSEETKHGTESLTSGRWLVTNNKDLIENEFYSRCTIDEALAYLETCEEIQVDSETEGFDPHTKKPLCWQLGDSIGKNQYLFPHSIEVIDRLKPLLERTDKLFVFANAQFDLRFLRHQNITVVKVWDIFLAECILTTGYDSQETDRGLALDDLVHAYTGNTLNKAVRGAIFKEGLSSRVIVYACEDVKYMSQVKEKQLIKLKSRDLLNVMQLENEAVIAVAALCYNGVKVDKSKWLEVIKQVNKIVTEQETTLDALVLKHPKLTKFKPRYTQTHLFGIEDARKTKINWSSNKQKLEILTELGIKDIDSVGDRVLQRHKKGVPIVKELIAYNKASKLQSSFGLKFLDHINPTTNRVHCDIWQILQTGRISVSKPNLNQIPSKGEIAKVIRSCFIPEEDNVIVGGDYSGMELRLIAEFSQDPIWINAFKEGKDLHSVLCAMTFDIPIEDIKKPFPHKPEMSYRDVQKTINFMLAYGGSEFKLADIMDITIKEAKSLIDKFFSKIPIVQKTLNMFGETAKNWGTIRTAAPYKRQRIFPKWEEAMLTKDFLLLGEIERAGKNHPLQGTNGDIIKLTASKVQAKIDSENLPIKLLLLVYDEVQTECPKEIAEWWRTELERIMIESAQVVIKTIPVVVECKISKHWEK